ncbi:MAG: glycoside hydrolase family 55 protein [Deltaproteobacteria bacterium]|nr:glycoside hydrolase family 55 protein [Deltaproteobacteria bacterium]
MVIVPPGGAGLAAGCWRRAYSGAINVRWFGARGNGNTLTDGAAIQAAINAAASRGGGVVFVPAGDYCVSATIYLPKRYGDQPVPIALVGEGAALSSTPLTGRRNGSCLRWTSM